MQWMPDLQICEHLVVFWYPQCFHSWDESNRFHTIGSMGMIYSPIHEWLMFCGSCGVQKFQESSTGWVISVVHIGIYWRLAISGYMKNSPGKRFQQSTQRFLCERFLLWVFRFFWKEVNSYEPNVSASFSTKARNQDPFHSLMRVVSWRESLHLKIMVGKMINKT